MVGRCGEMVVGKVNSYEGITDTNEGIEAHSVNS